MSGYKYTSSNLCDFICFVDKTLFLIECKTHKGASIPFENITQYNKLKEKVGIPGVRAGIILWLYEKENCIVYIPISTITKMKKDGLKSFGTRHLNSDKYFSLLLPSKKLKVFYETDYSPLLNLQDGQ